MEPTIDEIMKIEDPDIRRKAIRSRLEKIQKKLGYPVQHSDRIAEIIEKTYQDLAKQKN